MNNNEYTPRPVDFNQVCVWPGTIIGESEIPDFVEYFLTEFNTRVVFLETILTNPDVVMDRVVAGTGGRSDVFFAVHKDDVCKFAIPRLSLGIRWIEDVLSPANDSAYLYPSRVGEYVSWSVGVDRDEDEE